MTAPPEIFSATARRARRDRTARSALRDLEAHVAEALLDRVSMMRRDFAHVLVVNTGHGLVASALRARGSVVVETDHGPRFAAAASATLCEEDALDLHGQMFDLVVVPSGLDTVNDLPGALIAARRALAPDGLFLAALWGSPGLSSLRAALTAAGVGDHRTISRLHPQIDVRAAGDLLRRAGFALPVADVEPVSFSYASFDKLCDDLRSVGATNAMTHRYAVARAELDRARVAFRAMAGPGGRTTEDASLIMMTGWAPPMAKTT